MTGTGRACASQSTPAARSPTSSSRTTTAVPHVQGADDAGRPDRRRARRAVGGRRRLRPDRSRDLLGGARCSSTARRMPSTPSSPAAPPAPRFSPRRATATSWCCARAAAASRSTSPCPIPQPYVPRALTFEMPERIRADGYVMTPLDEAGGGGDRRSTWPRARSRRSPSACSGRSSIPATSCGSASCSPSICRACPSRCRIVLNPTLREYRRASSAAIDASLKPLMGSYLRDAGERGCATRALPVACWSSPRSAGVMDAARRRRGADPHRQLRPVDGAGRRAHYRRARRCRHANVIVADTGGTTYDVSLVRDGRIPTSRETWIGPPLSRHHDRLPLGRREERRRRRRLDRLGRRRRPAACRAAERRRGAGAGLLRPRRHASRR